MRDKFLVLGVLAAIPIVPILVLGLLILATQESRAAPPAITGLTATNTSYVHQEQIDLAWSPSGAEDFAYYTIYVSETEITDVTKPPPVGQINDRTDVTYQATRYKVLGLRLALVEDTKYWFAVTVVDSAGNESNVEASVSATIIMPPPIQTVFMKTDYDGVFTAILTVPVGTTVTWGDVDATNRGRFSTANPHTVTSDTGLFHGELRDRVVTFTYTFTETGVFGYHDQFGLDWLRRTGRVIVLEQAVWESAF